MCCVCSGLRSKRGGIFVVTFLKIILQHPLSAAFPPFVAVVVVVQPSDVAAAAAIVVVPLSHTLEQPVAADVCVFEVSLLLLLLYNSLLRANEQHGHNKFLSLLSLFLIGLKSRPERIL